MNPKSADESKYNQLIVSIRNTEKNFQSIHELRAQYDVFLANFPLCSGYWKKYADHGERLGFGAKAVYERAVIPLSYSVEMWDHYLNFAIRSYTDSKAIRSVFGRAIEYVGSDYLSDKLWDKYIAYEFLQQNWSAIAASYTKILSNPIQNLDHYFERFLTLASSHCLAELRTSKEAEEAKPSCLSEAEDMKNYVALRKSIYEKTKEEDLKVKVFEVAITRPYFHDRPLEVAQIKNWHKYLDFIEGVGRHSKMIQLYERCTLACANYPEFWIRYVSYMLDKGYAKGAEDILTRATNIFVKERPEIHEFAARFKELIEDRQSKLALQHKSTPERKKRRADDVIASDKAKLIKSNSCVRSSGGAYPINQAGASSVPPQTRPQVTRPLAKASCFVPHNTWPQVTQGPHVTRPQRTSYIVPPGAPQAAAYGAYGVYGSSYAQVPTPVPATYGVYPNHFIMPGAPQQAYGQPAGSVASSQPPQHTQPYYGGS